MASANQQWIVRVGDWYLQHPSGAWTKLPKEAHGYTYKGGDNAQYYGAANAAKGWQDYIEQMRKEPSMAHAPGVLPPDTLPLTASVQVMRRADGRSLLPEPPTVAPSPVSTMRVMCVGMGNIEVTPEAEHAIARFVVSVGFGRKWQLHLLPNGIAIDADIQQRASAARGILPGREGFDWTRIATLSRSRCAREKLDPLCVLFNEAYDYIITAERR